MAIVVAIIPIVVILLFFILFYCMNSGSINYNELPAEGVNEYTTKIRDSVSGLDKAKLEVYNYNNFELGSQLLSHYTPKTINEQAIANTMIDYINNNGILQIDYPKANITVIKDNRGDIYKAEQQINKVVPQKFKFISDNQNVHSSATSASLKDINSKIEEHKGPTDNTVVSSVPQVEPIIDSIVNDQTIPADKKTQSIGVLNRINKIDAFYEPLNKSEK